MKDELKICKNKFMRTKWWTILIESFHFSNRFTKIICLFKIKITRIHNRIFTIFLKTLTERFDFLFPCSEVSSRRETKIDRSIGYKKFRISMGGKTKKNNQGEEENVFLPPLFLADSPLLTAVVALENSYEFNVP